MKRWITVLLVAVLLLNLPLTAMSLETAQESKPICTVEDLIAIEENPDGSYILMNDLDLAGIRWKPLDFSGIFDGNGHAILNLSITHPGDDMPVVYDGNWKTYNSNCFGFFGTLRNAEVRNLKLLNVRGNVSCDGPAFMGALAGYGENVHISGCTVTANLELRAHDRIFGLGGLIGYAIGTMENCGLDLTLINVDTDPETLDEQFLGGVCAIGFMDIQDCTVKLDGYVSDHGYVHSGGVVGMYMSYPFIVHQAGNVKGLTLEGKITFFEHNADRRAYCGALEGEMMIGWCFTENNTLNFVRDERFVYDVELRPEMCPAPEYTETVMAPDCWEYGYTTYTCTACGYSFRDCYTFRNHEVTGWKLTKAPTVEEEGISVGYCACGMEFTQPVPKLEPETESKTEPTAEPTEEPTAEVPVYEEIPEGADPVFYIAWGSFCLLAILAVILVVTLCKRK